jgi:hypothetical protein
MQMWDWVSKGEHVNPLETLQFVSNPETLARFNKTEHEEERKELLNTSWTTGRFVYLRAPLFCDLLQLWR